MLRFLADLRAGYLTRGQATDAALPSQTVIRRLAELQLAEAAARYAAPDRRSARPPQIAVIGPTQAGKSTVVNLVLGREAAQVSPLAGFTVRAHGFQVAAGQADERWIADLFPGWRRLSDAPAARDEFAAFAFTTLRPGPDPERRDVGAGRASAAQDAPLPPECAVWDTPDFDSLSSHAYRRGVLEVIGLADVVLLVVSREKYADLSVWSLLRLIAPLDRPLLVCFNKLTPDARAPLVAALRARLAELGGAARDAPVLPLDLAPGLSLAAFRDAPQVVALRNQVLSLAQRAAGTDRTPATRAFIERHWSDWTAPIEAESDAHRQWRAAVDAALDEMRLAYRRDFLDHPQRYDSFRRVTIELLRLLELPGIAAGVHRVREVITWPARKLFALGRGWFRRTPGSASAGDGEERVLLEMVDRLLLRLERHAASQLEADAAGRSVWLAVSTRLREHGAALRQRLSDATRRHCDEVAAEIRIVADRLYETLQQRPALLNSLRAVRATADGVALIVAIKTGGIAAHDLIFAPAMLAVSSMLTEGALGGYMHHAAEELKHRQMRNVSESLLGGVFTPALHELSASASGVLGIDERRLREAAAALAGWGAGP